MLRIPPLLLCGICLLVILCIPSPLQAAWTTFSLPAVLKYPLVLGFCLAPVGLLVWSVLQFKAKRTTVNPVEPSQSSTLITDGLYARSRNPMYLAMLLALIGAALWREHIIGLLPLLTFYLWMHIIQIPREERALTQLFGESYTAYTHRVRRWI